MTNKKSSNTNGGGYAPSFGGGFRRRPNVDVSAIDYKDVKTLQKFVSERGRIMPARVTGVDSKTQRKIALSIKRARFLALMPYKVS